MRPPQALKHTREKAQKIAEKTGEAVSKGLTLSWDKAKVLGEDLKQLSRVHKRTKRSRTSRKRRQRKRDKE